MLYVAGLCVLYKTLKYTVHAERIYIYFFFTLNLVVYIITTGRYRVKHTPLRRVAQWIIAVHGLNLRCKLM
jgi:hypothetical protein